MNSLIYAQATIYPDLISVFIPKKPFEIGSHNINDSTPYSLNSRKAQHVAYKLDNPIERSIRRSKKIVRDCVLCNDFSIFATFTFRDNRYDVDEKRRQMSNWFKNQQKRNGKFMYLAVPEFHLDGALHFHVLMTDYTGKIQQAVNPNTGRSISKYGQKIYFFPEYTLGFSNFRFINKSIEDRLKIATYISKYITKDMPTFRNKKRYFCSNGLSRPSIVYNPSWYHSIKPDWQVETEYGTIMRFVRGNSKEIDKILGGQNG